MVEDMKKEILNVLEDFERDDIDSDNLFVPDPPTSVGGIFWFDPDIEPDDGIVDQLFDNLYEMGFTVTTYYNYREKDTLIALSISSRTNLASIEVVVGEKWYYKIFGDERDPHPYYYGDNDERDNLYRAYLDDIRFFGNDEIPIKEKEYRLERLGYKLEKTSPYPIHLGYPRASTTLR